MREGLTIDLGALARNYRRCCALAPAAQTAAVVKADAYGAGMAEVARALFEAGCRVFFVALAGEGVALRRSLKDVDIYVLDGLLPGTREACRAARLRPCLAHPDEIAEWRQTGLPAALHLDTGINRLGLDAAARACLEDPARLSGIHISLIMSHLACADEPHNPMNARQLKAFTEARARLAPVLSAPASLVNTAGLFLGAAYTGDLTRPGIGLYGGGPGGRDNPFEPVFYLTSRIAQTRMMDKGDSVGYGADYIARRRTRIAIVPLGYADGLPRTLWHPPRPAAAVIARRRAPLAGRVSMDMLCLDITDFPEDVCARGTPVEILGRTLTLDDLARAAGTIPHDIAVGLGRRQRRHHTHTPPPP